jgi:hypothetical protein
MKHLSSATPKLCDPTRHRMLYHYNKHRTLCDYSSADVSQASRSSDKTQLIWDGGTGWERRQGWKRYRGTVEWGLMFGALLDNCGS